MAEEPRIRCRDECGASVADVFDNAVPPAWRAELFALIACTPHLDWLLLTKRVGNVPAMLEAPGMQKDGLPRNVWLGISVVNQAEADRDIPKLLELEAAVHWLSIEPMLGPIDLRELVTRSDRLLTEAIDALRGEISCVTETGSGRIDRCTSVDWVVAGGESGPEARPAHPDWFRSLRDQCASACVPFLFKQWGEWVPYEHSAQPPFLWSQNGREIDGHFLPDFESDDGRAQTEWHCDWADQILARRVGKKAAGRLLDGIQHDGYPTP